MKFETVSAILCCTIISILLWLPESAKGAGYNNSKTVALDRVAVASRELSATESAVPRLALAETHNAEIRSVALSHDGSKLATGDLDGNIIIWSPKTMRFVRKIHADTSLVSRLAFTPDGEKLISRSRTREDLINDGDDTIQIFSVTTGNLINSIRIGRNNSHGDDQIVLNSTGTSFATNEKTKFKVWDLTSGRWLGAIPCGASDVTSIAWSKTQIATCGANSISLWDAHSYQLMRTLASPEPVTRLSLSPNGDVIAADTISSAKTHTLRFWSASTGAPQKDFQISGAALGFDWSSNQILLGDQGRVDVVNLNSSAVLRTLTKKSSGVVALCPVGTYAAEAQSRDATVELTLWNTLSGERIKSAKLAPRKITALALSPNGRFLAAAGIVSASDQFAEGENSIVLWDLSRGKKIAPLLNHTKEINCLAFSVDGKTLASGGMDCMIKLWEVETGKEISTFDSGFTSFVQCIQFSPNGKLLATGHYKSGMALWDLDKERRIKEVFEKDTVSCLAFSPDGGSLAVFKDEEGLEIWDVKKQQSLSSIEAKEKIEWHSNPIQFNHDGTKVTLAISTKEKNSSFKTWDIATKKPCAVPDVSQRDDLVCSGFSLGGTAAMHLSDGTIAVKKMGQQNFDSIAIAPSKPFAKVTSDNDGSCIAACDDFSITLMKRDSASNGKLAVVASIYCLGLTNWIAVTASGQFDAGDLDNLDAASWIFPGREDEPVPVESYMHHYFEPDLLSRRCRGETLRSVSSVLKLNPLQPIVEIESIQPHKHSTESVDVIVKYQSVSRRDQFGRTTRSGVYGLNLFLDDKRVACYPKVTKAAEDVDLTNGSDSSAFTHTFTVKLPRNSSEKFDFKVFGFNNEFVKSRTDFATFRLDKLEISTLRQKEKWDIREYTFKPFISEQRKMRDGSGICHGHSFVRFTPDGKRLFTVIDESVQSWSVADGQQNSVCSVPSPDEFVTMSGNGRFVARLDHGTIIVARTSSGLEYRSLETWSEGPIKLSATGQYLASVNPMRDVEIWDVFKGRKLATRRANPTYAQSFAFSEDGSLLAAGFDDGSISVCDVRSGKLLQKFTDVHSKSVRTLVFRDDRKVLISGGDDSKVVVWDLATEKLIKTFGFKDEPVQNLSFSADGRLLAASCDKIIKFWDAKSFSELPTVIQETDPVKAICFTNDSKSIVSSTDSQKSIRFWDCSSAAELPNKLEWIAAASSLVQLGKQLVVLSDYNWQFEIHRIDLLSHKIEKKTNIEKAHFRTDSVAVSPDCTTAAFACDDGLRLKDLKNGHLRLHNVFAGTDNTFATIQFSPDGKYLVCRGGELRNKDSNVAVDQSALYSLSKNEISKLTNKLSYSSGIQIVDVNTGLVAHYLPTDGDFGGDFAFCPDGKVLAFTQSGKVCLWDFLTGGEPVEVCEQREGSITFSADGKKLVVSGVNISIVDIATLEIKKIAGNRSDTKYGVALRSDGSTLAVGEDNGSVSIFDLSTEGEILRTVESTSEQEVDSLAYSPDNQSLASVTKGGALVLWDLRPIRVKKGRAYIIGFGVDEYTADDTIRDLDCAVADADAYGVELKAALNKSDRFTAVDFIPLYSKKPRKKVESKEFVFPATKRNLKTILDVLAGRPADDKVVADRLARSGITKIEPEDFVLMAFSSHGETYVPETNGNDIHSEDQQEFYILPQETVLDRSSKTALKVSLDKFGISSEDLTSWLDDFQADEVVMILDCCYSGAIVGEDFKPGPVNSRGLGQLAYYKGIRLLTASQADNTALEFKVLGHGLLTHALLIEGLELRMADCEPKDGTVTIREWLRYAVSKVPELDASSSRRGFRSTDSTIAAENLNRGSRVVESILNGKKVETAKKLQVPYLLDYSKGRDFELVGKRGGSDLSSK